MAVQTPEEALKALAYLDPKAPIGVLLKGLAHARDSLPNVVNVQVADGALDLVRKYLNGGVSAKRCENEGLRLFAHAEELDRVTPDLPPSTKHYLQACAQLAIAVGADVPKSPGATTVALAKCLEESTSLDVVCERGELHKGLSATLKKLKANPVKPDNPGPLRVRTSLFAD